MEIVENERPEEVEASLTLPGSPQDNVFIFIVDRSGSRGGEKLEMTKDALKLFI
jgi:hypothetical protein